MSSSNGSAAPTSRNSPTSPRRSAPANPVAVVTCVGVTADPCRNDDPAARVGRRLVVYPDRVDGTLGGERLDEAVTDDVRGMLAVGQTHALRYVYDGERRGDELQLFVASYQAPPRMVVFGAIDFAAAVARIGVFLGYRVTVCDARPVFAHQAPLPGRARGGGRLAAPVSGGGGRGRPHRRPYGGLRAHPRPEVRRPVARCGAPANRWPTWARWAPADPRRPAEAVAGTGSDRGRAGRLASPVGLDLGARTPEETAVSVAAEIIAARWGGSGERLMALAGRIQPRTITERFRQPGFCPLPTVPAKVFAALRICSPVRFQLEAKWRRSASRWTAWSTKTTSNPAPSW